MLVLVCCIFNTSSLAQNLDIDILKEINPTNPNSNFWVNASASTYPLATASTATLLAVSYLSKNKNLQNKGWKLAGSLLINTAITQSLKTVINRERPYEKYPTLITPYEYKVGHSFPSGHTSVAFATATSLTISCKKWYVVVPAFAWASSVAFSRLYLGEHYPTDIVVGALIGSGSAVISNWLTNKILKNKKK
ncbi:MAG: phosphatase PAP2 family protein [Chitinophagaceae bacterium]|nr:phosphatase PAP2 family protein [Chitinophagaceae bacterium]